MLRWLLLCTFLICSANAIGHESEEPMIIGCISPASPLRVDKSDALVVHEWGTFTTLQGSDGTRLSGLYREEEHLPPFVYHHGGFSPDPIVQGSKGLYKPLLNATVKMETPVLYFYSPQETDFSVRVDFPQGTISQWYPQRIDGETMPIDSDDINLNVPFNGWIEWKGTILAPGTLVKNTPPADQQTATWTAPRNTDANEVQAHNGETEKFLFYRGVGNFEIPVEVSFTPQGELVVTNSGADRIPYVFVFNKEQNLSSVWWTGALGAGESRSVERPATAPTAADYFGEFEEALVEAGLYPKEAAAMLNTWRASYFDSYGLRVFWIVPRNFTDRMLPAELTPEPLGFERVMVGRSEVLSPKFEKQLLADFTHGKEDLWRDDRYYLAYKERVEYMLATTPVTSVEQQSDSTIEELRVFPNPTTGKVKVELRFAALLPPDYNGTSVHLSLSSISGVRLLTREGEMQDNMYNEELDLEQFAVGMYILTIEADGRTWTKKIARE